MKGSSVGFVVAAVAGAAVCGIVPEASPWLSVPALSPAQSSTPLGALAAQMQPGTWAELNTTGLDALLPQPNILNYSDEGVWDPVAREYYVYGACFQLASCGAGGQIFGKYSASTNAWLRLPDPPFSITGHLYDHFAINPSARMLYYRRYGTPELHQYNIQTGAWNRLPDIPSDVARGVNCCGALEYFPEMNGLVYFEGDLGDLGLFSFTTNQWVSLARSLTGFGWIHHFSEYSAKHKVVIFGGGEGGVDSRTVYRLDATGTVTRMQEAPVPLAIHQSIITTDPVSGNFLVFANDKQAYEYDPTGAWTRLSIPTAPFFLIPTDPAVTEVYAAPVSNHGVTMFVKYDAAVSPPHHVYLYKHFTGGPPPPSDAQPPTVPSNLTASTVSSSRIILSWTSSTDNVAVAGYRVFRDGTLAGTTSRNAYSDTGLSASTTYTYTAAAFDAAGNVSALSSPASEDTGTTPVDGDGDGLPDAWEGFHFGDLAQTASGDPDGDGFSNLQEYQAGSDPTGGTSVPAGQGGGGGDRRACGATGIEAVLVLGMALGLRRKARATLFLLMLALPLAAQQAKPKAPAGAHPHTDQAKVDAAIRKGVAYLNTRLGDLPYDNGCCADELVLWTFVHAGVPESDPDFRKLFEKMMAEPILRTYCTSLQAMILEELDRVKYQPRIAQCAQFLVDNQARNGQWSYGEPTPFLQDVPTGAPKGDVATGRARSRVKDFDPAPVGPRHKPVVRSTVTIKQMRVQGDEGDNSNTQYAALGLRACHDAGVVIPSEVAHLARKWWRDAQEDDGSWNYLRKGGGGGNFAWFGALSE